MARRSVSTKPGSPSVRLRLFRLRPRVFAGLMFLVALGAGSHYLWRQQAPAIARHPQYQLTAARIHITPPPPWIRTDIKTQVLRDAGLPGTLTLLDDSDALARRMREAFEFHPWIASVQRITKQLPASLEVELVYRRPIAAVESSDASGVTFLPIDEQAVRLPENDLTDAERRRLPRISGVSGRPLVGDRWTDPRVLGGVRLIAALADVWQRLQLVEVLAALRSPPADTPAYTFELVTTGGTRIVWGAAPGEEDVAGEAQFDEKLQRLMHYARQHGQFDSIDGPAAIDVRNELVVTPRVVQRIGPAQNK